jgi:hypothetical protein
MTVKDLKNSKMLNVMSDKTKSLCVKDKINFDLENKRCYRTKEFSCKSHICGRCSLKNTCSGGTGPKLKMNKWGEFKK